MEYLLLSKATIAFFRVISKSLFNNCPIIPRYTRYNLSHWKHY
jgi:hypothetical protein